MADSYKMRIQCEIIRIDEHGCFTSDRLSIADEVTISAGSFLGVAQILGRFHELAERIRTEKEPPF